MLKIGITLNRCYLLLSTDYLWKMHMGGNAGWKSSLPAVYSLM